MNIGIPTLNRYDKLAECLQSIERSTLVPKVTIVDNGGKFQSPQMDLSIYTPDKNLGVAASWNWLIDIVEEPLLICNDDIQFGLNDIQAFEDMYRSSDAGLLYTDNLNFLNMFSCFMIRPQTIEQIGKFDEAFYPAYFEDCDYFRRMFLGGISWQSVPTRIEHSASSTLEAYTTAQLNQHHTDFRKNRDYYVQKWGAGPEHEIYKTAFNK